MKLLILQEEIIRDKIEYLLNDVSHDNREEHAFYVGKAHMLRDLARELKAEREKLIQSKSSEDVDISLEDYCFISGRIEQINELLGETNE